MHVHRQRLLNQFSFKSGHRVYYWMQATQRVEHNFALERAVMLANQENVPLTVLFVLVPDFPEANLRHYVFMLQGLAEVSKKLKVLNISFELKIGAFDKILASALNDAGALIMDKGYLKPMRVLREKIVAMATEHAVPVVEVESDLIVPVERASNKCEYGARTIRPKLWKQVDTYLDVADIKAVKKGKARVDEVNVDTLIKQLDLKDCLPAVDTLKGGTDAAIARLNAFVEHDLKNYLTSNDPGTGKTSGLSPYLHFGQLSPIEIYLAVDAQRDTVTEAVEAFLEQLLVRRELAFNFVYYCDGYDTFETMTHEWAYQSMAIHLEDTRKYRYNIEDYMQYKTHDEPFNAAMREMVETGSMHNTMRMYWGKKIIEWSPDYKTAYQTILTLNNRLFIDGRDPVSYASVAWLFGRHDRAFQTMPIFGKMRSMTEKGLWRKYDMARYIDTFGR